MTNTSRIMSRILQGVALAATIEATVFAQTDARAAASKPVDLRHATARVEPLAIPQVHLGVLPQPPAMPSPVPTLSPVPMPSPEQVMFNELAGDTRAFTSRPDYRLMFAGQDGLHASFVTPMAARESEQLRVQGSLAILSAFISQQNAARAARGRAETPASARAAGAR